MSEEDTFRVLSRPTFQEMLVKYEQFNDSWASVLIGEREKFCARHGWTYQEFKKLREAWGK